MCVCVAFGIQHAMRMSCIVICGLPGSTIFFHPISWRRMEKISWTDHVRNEDVLLRVKEQRTILHEIRKRKANWISHFV